MSRVFMDTSAAYALLVSSDEHHASAAHAFQRIQERTLRLLTSSYVLVETYALLGRRVGLDAVAAFRDDVEPLLDVTWVDGDLHSRGLEFLVRRGDASLSLVDAVSFLLMRQEGIDEAFVYDTHFEGEGFSALR